MKPKIDNYKEKKLVKWLYPNANVLIIFNHGLGDTIMFYPVYETLKDVYPDVNFHLYVTNGQEEIFDASPLEDEKYDLIFHLHYPMCEHTKMTKNEYCCLEEIGIDPRSTVKEFATIPSYPSPFIAVHLNGTALPGSVNCPVDYAKQIWNDIIEEGFVPIECHYKHIFHNPVNSQMPFITNTVRNCKATLPSLFGLLQHCSGFIGVASGPLTVALSLYPERVMYLKKGHHIYSYSKKDISWVDVAKEYDTVKMKNFLQSLRG